MKIEIIDDSSFPLDAANNRIEEIDDIIEVDTCFICNGTPSVTKTIYPEKGIKKVLCQTLYKIFSNMCKSIEKRICIHISVV